VGHELNVDLSTSSQRAKAARAGMHRLSSGSIQFDQPCPCGISGWAGATIGAKKHQDRFLCVPNLVDGVLYCGVFDGHADDGHIIAERAARTIAKELSESLKWMADDAKVYEKNGLQAFEERISQSFSDTYLKFQATIAEEYANEVILPPLCYLTDMPDSSPCLPSPLSC
jgi:hypothetical protein